MKKVIILLVVVGLFTLTSCSTPADKTVDDMKYSTNQYETTQNLNTDSDGDEKAGEDREKDGKKVDQTVNDQQKLAVVLYYQDREGYIVPVTRWVTKQEGIARAAINEIIDTTINREELEYYGFYPVLPVGTEILGITIRDGTAIIDFSKELLGYRDEIAEKNIISSIVYTLTEFKTINDVKILINGYASEKLKYGTDISMALSRNNVLINLERLKPKEGFDKVDAYLFKGTDDGNNYILPVSFEIPKSDMSELPKKIVDLLSGSNENKGFYSEMPTGVKLLSSTIKGNVLVLDFNKAIAGYDGGTSRENALLEQILFSMKQLKDVEMVKLLVNGKIFSLPEGTDISGELQIPEVINDVIDS